MVIVFVYLRVCVCVFWYETVGSISLNILFRASLLVELRTMQTFAKYITNQTLSLASLYTLLNLLELPAEKAINQEPIKKVQ